MPAFVPLFAPPPKLGRHYIKLPKLDVVELYPAPPPEMPPFVIGANVTAIELNGVTVTKHSQYEPSAPPVPY